MQKTDITTKDYDINVYFGDGKYRDTPRKEAYGHVKYLYTDLTDIRKYYIRLGFHLVEFERLGYHFDFGYATLADFCMANLGLDKSAVSRCINVYREFNAGVDQENIRGLEKHGCAMDLSDRWNEYSYTQLCEMLPLSPKEREAVTPDMTIKQIREFKKQLKSSKQPVAPTQPEESGSGSVASMQPKKFYYDECLSKSGIVRQNYIKSRDSFDSSVGLFDILLFDSRGKEVFIHYWGEILEQCSGRLVIRLCDPFDPVHSLNYKQPDQKGDHNE